MATRSPAVISEIIELALSDHVSFQQIQTMYGLKPDEVKALMRQNLKRGSYLAWRRRVRTFSDRRETYK
ncbi:TIGR03643, TIGR03643 family protein [Burkholderiales bacterium]